MKNRKSPFFFFFLSALLFLTSTACVNAPNRTAPEDEKKRPDKQTEIEKPPLAKNEEKKSVPKVMKLADESDPLCPVWGVFDQRDNPVEVPAEIEKALACPMIGAISPDGRYLLIDDGFAIKLLDFSTQKVATLLSLHDDSDGCSDGLWSPDGRRVAFVNVNQNRYKNRTMLFVLTIEDGEMIEKRKLDREIHMVCGSYCASDAGEDFWFKDHETIAYYRIHPDWGEGEEQETPLEIRL